MPANHTFFADTTGAFAPAHRPCIFTRASLLHPVLKRRAKARTPIWRGLPGSIPDALPRSRFLALDKLGKRHSPPAQIVVAAIALVEVRDTVGAWLSVNPVLASKLPGISIH